MFFQHIFLKPKLWKRCGHFFFPATFSTWWLYNHMLSPSTYTAPSCTAVLATILPAAACCSRRALRPKGGRTHTPQKKSHLFEKRNAVSNIQGQPTTIKRNPVQLHALYRCIFFFYGIFLNPNGVWIGVGGARMMMMMMMVMMHIL